jgi:hypothetical protein
MKHCEWKEFVGKDLKGDFRIGYYVGDSFIALEHIGEGLPILLTPAQARGMAMALNEAARGIYDINGATIEHYTNLVNAVHDLIVAFDNAASNNIDVVNRIDILRVVLAQVRQHKEAQNRCQNNSNR